MLRREKRLLLSSWLSVHPSVRMCQFSFQCTDLREIWFYDLFENFSTPILYWYQLDKQFFYINYINYIKLHKMRNLILCNLYKKIVYQVDINKGIILRCTAYQISRAPTCFGVITIIRERTIRSCLKLLLLKQSINP